MRTELVNIGNVGWKSLQQIWQKFGKTGIFWWNLNKNNYKFWKILRRRLYEKFQEISE